jgi:protein-serine/threonine kinase
VIPNHFVSNKHLRIYTILYDREILHEIPPLVYAQDLSLNGTLWNDYPMGRGKGSFLLSDGDTLQITQGEYLRFNCARDNRPDPFSRLQRIEMRVRLVFPAFVDSFIALTVILSGIQ